MDSEKRTRATRILQRARDGDAASVSALMPLVYEELRSVAGTYLGRERPGHTLQPTALVHETYLRLFESEELGALDQAHFVAIAAGVMRRILVEHARARAAEKRGGGASRLTLQGDEVADLGPDVEILDLDRALEKLSVLEERLGRVVVLRFFGGLTVEEVAQELGISKRSVEADWTFARTWLRREMGAT